MELCAVLEGYWLARQRDLSVNTFNDYTLHFRRMGEFFGTDREFETIGSDELHAFLNHCKNKFKLGPKTMSNLWAALSSLWTWAETEPSLRTPHAIRGVIKRPQFRQPPIVPYSEHDIKALLAACDHCAVWVPAQNRYMQGNRSTAHRDRAIIVVLLDSGLRASELASLCYGDYEAKLGRLHVRQGKGGKDRHVFLGATGRRLLWRYLATRKNIRPTEPLFATRDLTPLNRNSLLLLIKRIAMRAEVSDAGLHRFRHTFAINFLRNGGNVLELQRMLGHEKLDTLNIYVRLAQSDLSNAQRIASPADKWRL
jgi:integrase/recombinase XerD